MMHNSAPEGQIFLSAPYTHDRLFFLHRFWWICFNVAKGLNTEKSHFKTVRCANNCYIEDFKYIYSSRLKQDFFAELMSAMVNYVMCAIVNDFIAFYLSCYMAFQENFEEAFEEIQTVIDDYKDAVKPP